MGTSGANKNKMNEPIEGLAKNVKKWKWKHLEIAPQLRTNIVPKDQEELDIAEMKTKGYKLKASTTYRGLRKLVYEKNNQK